MVSRSKNGNEKLRVIVIGSSLFSSFTLGSNDVSNAISSIVKTGLMRGIFSHIFGCFSLLWASSPRAGGLPDLFEITANHVHYQYSAFQIE